MHRFKIAFLLAALIYLVLIFGFDVARSDASRESEPMKIGAILPLTGDYAQYGKELWRGIEIAAIELEREMRRVELYLEDGATMTASSSLSAAAKLVRIDRVRLLMVLGADDVGPLVGLSSQTGVPILSLWDSSPELLAKGELVFSNGFEVGVTGEKIARYASERLNAGRAAIIGNSTAWSTAAMTAFRRKFIGEGGEIVFEKITEDVMNDFRSLIPQLKKAKPDVVYLPLSLPSTVEACIRQLRQGGVSEPIFTGEAFVGDAIKRLDRHSEGVYVAWLPRGDTELDALYRKKYGEVAWDLAVAQVGYRGLIEVAKASKRGLPLLRDNLAAHFGKSSSGGNALELYQVRNAQLRPVR